MTIWVRVFNFLRLQNQSGVVQYMYCEYCTKANAKNKWNAKKEYINRQGEHIRGIRRFKIDGIREHSINDKHRDNQTNENCIIYDRGKVSYP